MDFALSDELGEFQKSVKDFLEAKGGTKVARQLIKGNTEMFNQTFEGLAELGATAATISDENDGLGLGTEALIPIFEELGRVLLPGTLLETLALRSEEHTSELQSRGHLVCRLLLEKKKKKQTAHQLKQRRVYHTIKHHQCD